MRVVFERFTDRARRVVVLAQEEARLLSHNFIGTEHLLLGLIHEGEGVAAQTLEALEVSLEAVRTRVEAIVGRGTDSPSGHIPFTPRAKKVLEMALREALQLGHNWIGTEHILLGLIREGRGVAADVLGDLGVDLARVRVQVVEILSEAGPEPIENPPASQGGEGLVVESLMSEVRRLRADVDHLRDALRRIESEPAPPRPEAVPRLADPQSAPESAGFRNLLHCSFCSEPHDQVTKLVAGPGVYICDRCIRLCQEILDEVIPPGDDPE